MINHNFEGNDGTLERERKKVDWAEEMLSFLEDSYSSIRAVMEGVDARMVELVELGMI